ncbi:hypothetical protein H6G80_10170 [Nostoc sp. FACHB-87]|uniref:hypothetical protein n=1 Tax=Nostocaceae TaxID=1162 RepID=UPI00168715C0|nr:MULTISPECIES: hypothetical protein [Nostocaceae]MBD2298672.1 hypothetical protein [Nostoc sp. FACHB-190]MBD2454444.1 hypothetical protein [Nostoc sp. FACHB-87]MBD2474370.1 hypothetical protein [Anabaena sp. FACHB-83]
MNRFTYAAICAVAVFLPTVASAGEIYAREVNQQQRIYHGVKNGSINRAELRQLERREASLEAARRRDIRSDGHLTPQERRQLNRRQNRLSRTIYRDKHD